jgi:hypothetical protein
VPLQEVIDDVTEVMYDDNTDSIFKTHKKKITKRVFKNILKACSENIFLYNNRVYKQIDGLSMGSPLAPILANWFVAKIESKLLEDSAIKQPKFYKRYVDDIFAVFESKEDRDVFYNHLNNAHNNMQFTMETVNTSTKSLPFLDVEIKITQSSQFETKVFRKPTNTNVLMNYEAMAPKKWKKSIIMGFLHRAKRITSSQKLFEEELNNIREIFRANGYPLSFVNNTIDEFITERKTDDNQEQKPSIMEQNDGQKQIYFVLPYTGKVSEKLHKRINNEMKQHRINLMAAYRTTKVGLYFSLKQTSPPLFKNDVVYSFQCPCDKDTRYIGETERHFYKRIMEHCSTNANKEPSTSSAVYNHIARCPDCSTNDNIVECFSVIRTCNNNTILSEEALCIRKYQPSLNIQLGTFKGSRVPTHVFN